MIEPPGRAVILRQLPARASPNVSAEIREVSERREVAWERGRDRDRESIELLL